MARLRPSEIFPTLDSADARYAKPADITTALAAYAAPYAKVGMSAAVSATNNVARSIPFDTEAEDTDSQHDNATNNTRLTCVKAGLYLATVQMEWASNTTGRRVVQVSKTNEWSTLGKTLTQTVAPANAAFEQLFSGPVRMIVGDYLEAVVFQNSGGGLNVGGLSSFMSMLWLRS